MKLYYVDTDYMRYGDIFSVERDAVELVATKPNIVVRANPSLTGKVANTLNTTLRLEARPSIYDAGPFRVPPYLAAYSWGVILRWGHKEVP